MAVIISKKVDFGRGEVKLRVFLPPGKITKAEREKAEHLDGFLTKRMPEIEKEMRKDGMLNKEALKKWHSLGKQLQFVDNPNLVDPTDVHERRIWLALREHCPPVLLPKGEKQRDNEGSISKRGGKKYDHFELCYRLAKYDWSHVNWIPTWTEWVDLIEAPGLVRDVRVVPEIGEQTASIKPEILKEKFRNIIKELRKEFPTKEKIIESTGFADSIIKKKIKRAFRRALCEKGNR